MYQKVVMTSYLKITSFLEFEKATIVFLAPFPVGSASKLASTGTQQWRRGTRFFVSNSVFGINAEVT